MAMNHLRALGHHS